MTASLENLSLWLRYLPLAHSPGGEMGMERSPASITKRER